MQRIALRLPQNAPALLHTLVAALEGCRYHPEDVAAISREAEGAQEKPPMAGLVADWLGVSLCPWC
jgi:hypothetical protein